MKLQTKFLQVLLAALLVAATMGAAEEPFVDDTMTIALWHMDEITRVTPSWNGVADDTSITGRSGIALMTEPFENTDPDPYPTVTTGGGGKFSEALQFDSSKQQSAFRDGVWEDLEGAKVELWFKQDAGVTAEQSPLSVNNVFDMRASEGSLVVWVWQEEGNPKALTASYTQGEWTSVKLIIEGENMELTVNGNTQTRTLPGSMAIATGRVLVGRSPGGDGRFFDGLIDEVKFSNTEYPDFYYPFEDAYGTFMLWHMDEKYEESNKLYVDDDDSVNPERGYDLLMLDGGGAARPGEGTGPQITGGYPSEAADFGNALYFDGLNDSARVNIDNDNLGIDGTNFRFEAWVKLDDSINTYGGGAQYYIGYHSGRFALYLQDGSAGWQIVWSNWWDGGSHAMARDYPNHKQWHHVAGEFYEGRRRLYLDGVLIWDREAQYAGDTVNDGSGYLYVGAQSSSTNPFYGTIDEVRISPAEPTDAPCGYWGYHAADLNQDCYVDIDDLKIMVGNWLKCSIPDDPDCQQFN